MRHLTWLLLCVATFFSAEAAAQFPLDEKMRLEQYMTLQVNSMLDKFVGPGKSHVTVMLTVEATQPPEAGAGADGKKSGLKDALSPKIQSTWMWKEISRKPKLAVLPGFAVSPELSLTDNREKKPKNPEPELADEPAGPAAPLLEIKRTLVSIVLDSSLSDKNIKMVEVLVSETLGLDPERGDRLNVYKLPLQPAWRWTLQTPQNIRSVFWIVTGLLSAITMLWLLSALSQRVRRALGYGPDKKEPEAVKKGKEQEPKVKAAAVPAAADAGGARSGGAPASRAEAAESAQSRQTLDFITGENIEVLAELVQDSEPREIACLLGFLEPSLACQVLDHLQVEKRVKTLLEMSSVGFVQPKTLDEMKESWRERLSYAYGGTAAVGELLSAAEPTVQDALLAQLKHQSPELARKVDCAMIRFEDIFTRRDDQLALIAQAASFEDWAKAMVGFPETGKKRLLAALPEASRNAMKEWMTFTTAPQSQIAQARMKIIQAARELRRLGKIDFSKGQAVAKALPPAPPPLPAAAKTL